MDDVHVEPDCDHWKVTSHGRTVSTHRTRPLAVSEARVLAAGASVAVVIHDRDELTPA